MTARFSTRDVVAGASVALVLIPQSVAYAELLGVPGSHGLYAAALAPLAASFFASSPYLQTGPVALTALLSLGALHSVAEPGTAGYAGLAALLAVLVGLFRIVIGWARVGWVSYFMSRPMLEGFTAGAALLIIGSQVPAALGVRPPQAGIVSGMVWALRHPGAWSATSMILTVLTVVAIFGARRIHPRLPGVLLATAGALLFSALTDYEGATVGAVVAGLPRLSLALPWRSVPDLMLAAGVIALVGFAEVASIARVYATRERQEWSPSREFVSQGAANLAAGLGGGFPVGGSFSRSSLNHLAGARTRWSGAVTGIAVLAFLPFAGILADLPTAVLAGIIIAGTLGLVRLKTLVRLWGLSRAQAGVAWATFFLCLVLAPRIDHAVILGMGAALAVHVLREMKPGSDAHTDGGTVHLHPRGVLWYGSAPRMERALLQSLSEARSARRVVIHLGGLGRIDLTGALVLEQILEEARGAGLDVEIVNVPRHARRVLGKVLGWQEGLGLPPATPAPPPARPETAPDPPSGT